MDHIQALTKIANTAQHNAFNNTPQGNAPVVGGTASWFNPSEWLQPIMDFAQQLFDQASFVYEGIQLKNKLYDDNGDIKLDVLQGLSKREKDVLHWGSDFYTGDQRIALQNLAKAEKGNSAVDKAVELQELSKKGFWDYVKDPAAIQNYFSDKTALKDKWEALSPADKLDLIALDEAQGGKLGVKKMLDTANKDYVDTNNAWWNFSTWGQEDKKLNQQEYNMFAEKQRRLREAGDPSALSEQEVLRRGADRGVTTDYHGNNVLDQYNNKYGSNPYAKAVGIAAGDSNTRQQTLNNTGNIQGTDQYYVDPSTGQYYKDPSTGKPILVTAEQQAEADNLYRADMQQAKELEPSAPVKALDTLNNAMFGGSFALPFVKAVPGLNTALKAGTKFAGKIAPPILLMEAAVGAYDGAVMNEKQQQAHIEKTREGILGDGYIGDYVNIFDPEARKKAWKNMSVTNVGKQVVNSAASRLDFIDHGRNIVLAPRIAYDTVSEYFGNWDKEAEIAKKDREIQAKRQAIKNGTYISKNDMRNMPAGAGASINGLAKPPNTKQPSTTAINKQPVTPSTGIKPPVIKTAVNNNNNVKPPANIKQPSIKPLTPTGPGNNTTHNA